MRRSDQGSAFIESLIAAAIVCLALGATFQVIADSTGRARQNQARGAAYLVAQSELADVGAEIPLQPGKTSGVSGPFAWTVDMAPFETGQASSTAGALLQVTVQVQARQGGPQLATLQSLRVARTG
jgi:type II secretory pathway pseudopilin PulG